jgi:hypothetical protein
MIKKKPHAQIRETEENRVSLPLGDLCVRLFSAVSAASAIDAL